MGGTNGSILTIKGQELIANSQASGVPIEWTRMAIGSKPLVGEAKELEELIEKIMDINVTSVKSEGAAFKIRGNFNNENIKENTDFKEIGIYAKNKNLEECLYAYINTGEEGGEIIPPITSGRIERVLDVVSTIGDGNNITFTIDNSLFTTIYDLEEGLATKEDKFEKKTGFNLDKVDDPEEVESLDEVGEGSFLVATGKALKKVWDKMMELVGIQKNLEDYAKHSTTYISKLYTFNHSRVSINVQCYRVGDILTINMTGNISDDKALLHTEKIIVDVLFRPFAPLYIVMGDESGSNIEAYISTNGSIHLRRAAVGTGSASSVYQHVGTGTTIGAKRYVY